MGTPLLRIAEVQTMTIDKIREFRKNGGLIVIYDNRKHGLFGVGLVGTGIENPICMEMWEAIKGGRLHDAVFTIYKNGSYRMSEATTRYKLLLTESNYRKDGRK